MIIELLLQIGLLFDSCLVEAVDNGIFALGGKNAFYFSAVFEAYLADVHASVFFEVGPGRVDDCDVVLFVSCVL